MKKHFLKAFFWFISFVIAGFIIQFVNGSGFGNINYLKIFLRASISGIVMFFYSYFSLKWRKEEEEKIQKEKQQEES